MRKQERQVLENAIKTVNNGIECKLKQETVNTKICMSYLEINIDDLIGYASIQCRFAGMNVKDFTEFIDTVMEFEKLMYDKINNASI